jgi:hypothetical protein
MRQAADAGSCPWFPVDFFLIRFLNFRFLYCCGVETPNSAASLEVGNLIRGLSRYELRRWCNAQRVWEPALSNCGSRCVATNCLTQRCQLCRVRETGLFGGIGMSIRQEDRFGPT